MGTFNATEQAYIKTVWARAAEKYVSTNVNVTTVDPAIAAAQAANTTGSTTVPNDVSLLLTNAGMTSFLDDGIGHSVAAAAALAFSGSGALTPQATRDT